MRPRLKDVVWERAGTDLWVVYDRREQLLIDDADGIVERLLELVRPGVRTIDELAAALSERGTLIPTSDVADAVTLLDEYRLVEDGTAAPVPDADRYAANLGFFESFATQARCSADFQHQLRAAHVLVLGTGGLNSTTIPHLCGLGVGRLTLLDRDRVEPRNFARQYLYRWSDIGAAKVQRAAAWVHEFDPAIVVQAIDGSIDEPAALGGLLERCRPDVVMAGIDQPAAIAEWINDECVRRRIPFVRAGMWVTQGVVWSVEPGVSACLRCSLLATLGSAEQTTPADPELAELYAGVRLWNAGRRVNRAMGPVTGLLGSLAVFEVLRLLTRFEPPAYAGRPLVVDFAAGCRMEQTAWTRDPRCPACGEATGTRHREEEA